MDYVISFTPAQLIAGILAICGGITAIAAAIGQIVKGIKLAKAPREELENRVKKLEEKSEKCDQCFQNDKLRLESIEDGNMVTQRALLALLSHGIDGNDVDAMRSARDELQDYLIEHHTLTHRRKE